MMEKSQFWGCRLHSSSTEPRLAAWYAEQYQPELPIFDYPEILMRCQSRLDQVKQLAEEESAVIELSGMMPDPMMVASSIVDQVTPAIDVLEDNHPIKAEVLREFLDDDEVAEWSPIMRAAVQELINRHIRFDRDYRYGLQALEAEGQIGVQSMVNNAMMAGQPTQEDQMLAEGADRVAGLIEAEESFDREQEAAELDHARALELEQVKAQSKPKGKGTK